jgi:YHS domain-containing protein
MNVKILFIMLLISFNYSCSNHTSRREMKSDYIITQEEVIPNLKSAHISILNLIKKVENDYDTTYFKECSDWMLNRSLLSEILPYFTHISEHDFMYLYYVLPCEIVGKIKIDSIDYDLVINGGAYISLSHNGKTYYFGCSEDKCKDFFIETGGNPNRDLIQE